MVVLAGLLIGHFVLAGIFSEISPIVVRRPIGLRGGSGAVLLLSHAI